MALSWSVANRIASIAATQAHDELGVDTSVAPIDVATAIARAGVVLMYRPMPTLFGAYLADTPVPGILVNNRMSRAVRRHSAAHELGHHRFGHGTVLDHGATGDPAVPPSVTAGAPDTERTAEAFASWFLMPRRTVRAVLDALGVAPPLTAEQVYQVSLRMGTSYASTARHLVSLRLADVERSRQWLTVAPGRLKRRLGREAVESTLGVDVWDITAPPGGEATTIVSPGDLLVVDGQDNAPHVEGPGVAEPLASSPGRWIVRCNGDGDGEAAGLAITTASGQTAVRVATRPAGRWAPPVAVLDSDGV